MQYSGGYGNNSVPTERAPRALVTGGAGFLGSHVCESLLAAGMRVVCLDNFATGFPRNIETLMAEPRFTLLTLDLADGSPEVGEFDLVVHLAAPTSPFQYSAMPIQIARAGGQGTRHALETARRCDARFVLASTSKVYCDAWPNPQQESNVGPIPLHRANTARAAYDGSRFAEALTVAYRKTHHVDTGILRIFNTYGPGMRDDDGGVVATFIQQALDGEPLIVNGMGRQSRSLCYVEDTVDAITRMAASLHPGPIDIGHPEETSILDLARQVISVTGSSSEIRLDEAAADEPPAPSPDVSTALDQLAWRPRIDLPEGLARTVQAKLLSRQLRAASVSSATDDLWGLDMRGGTIRVH